MGRPIAVYGARTSADASIVMVTHDNLVVTRMCVESVLANTGGVSFELVIVDNASTDSTPAYLQDLVARDRRVRVVLNDENQGFAAGVNTGLRAAVADVLVVLNNDVIVAPGWLAGLRSHLGDERVGMVGPVTNAAPNEARVPTSYTTYGQFLAEAAMRRSEHGGEAFDIPVLTMFCVALRRSVFEAVGPLDEQFGKGMFEDDDYSARVLEAGYRVVCAEDLLVHHFGEASFGNLVATGEHAALMARNRRRYEEKWGRSWSPHARRRFPDYLRLVEHVRVAVDRHIPAGESIVVVSRGDDELVRLGDRRGLHFPAHEDGGFAGHYPADSEAAVEELESRRRAGALFVVLPRTSFWWLDHYPGFARHIHARYTALFVDDWCRIYGSSGASDRYDPPRESADGTVTRHPELDPLGRRTGTIR